MCSADVGLSAGDQIEGNALETARSKCLADRIREIHPLDLQPHRHSMLVPRVCAPRVTRRRLGKYW